MIIAQPRSMGSARTIRWVQNWEKEEDEEEEDLIIYVRCSRSFACVQLGERGH